MGQREPTKQELNLAREQAGQSMQQMTHCQQCRADAVGKLGQDIDLAALENSEPAQAARSIQVAVASSSLQLIDQHFGHATQFSMYRVTADEITQLDDFVWQQYCQGSEQCDDSAVKDLSQLKHVDTILCSRIGHAPQQELSAMNVKANTDYALRDIQGALEDLQQQLAVQQANISKSSCSMGECS
jgi:nitrogen fixation protein NifB